MRMLCGQGRFAEGEALPQHVLTGKERVPATKHLDPLLPKTTSRVRREDMEEGRGGG